MSTVSVTDFGAAGTDGRGIVWQTTAPIAPQAGDVWVDSDSATSILSLPLATAQIADGAVTPVKQSGGYSTQTGTYGIVATDRIVNCTGTWTATLPTAIGIAGQTFTVKNSGTGLITLATSSSQTIDGSATKTLYRYDSITVASDGANWIVI